MSGLGEISSEGIERIAKCIQGLLSIAEQAMPETYFQTDRRVKAARKLLREMDKKMNRAE